MKNIKSTVEATLQPIIGSKLEGISRAYKKQELHFNILPFILNKREVVYIGEYILSIDCAWRFTNSYKLITGYNDVYQSTDDSDLEEFDDDIPRQNLRDERLWEIIFSEIELKVTRITASDFGDVRISFTNGYIIDVFIDNTNFDNNPYLSLFNLGSMEVSILKGED